MDNDEKIKILLETSKDILGFYEQNIGNNNIGLELRNLMYDNMNTLSSLMNDYENLNLFNPKDPDIINLKEEFFIVFNDCIIKNIEIFNVIYSKAGEKNKIK